MQIGMIDLQMGNLFSVEKAFLSLGEEVQRLQEPAQVEGLDLLVLPGVGHFGKAMEALVEAGWQDKILGWLKEDRPFLGICLGLQILFAYSEEGKRAGLGFFEETICGFSHTLKVPHMGWNRVVFSDEAFLPFQESYFYFVHSFYAPLCPSTVGRSEYGMPFSAAVRRGNVIGVQFHPEKSQKKGLTFLKSVLDIFSYADCT